MTDYTDLIARLRRQADALHPESLASRNAAEALAAIAALQADIAALHKRQHELECLATERLRENVALTAERDALRGALGKLAAAGDDLMDEAKSLSRAASSDIYEPYRKAWEEARAAITAPTTGC